MKVIFLKLIFNFLHELYNDYMNFIMIYHFYQKIETDKFEKSVANLHDKTEYVIQ